MKKIELNEANEVLDAQVLSLIRQVNGLIIALQHIPSLAHVVNHRDILCRMANLHTYSSIISTCTEFLADLKHIAMVAPKKHKLNWPYLIGHYEIALQEIRTTYVLLTTEF